MSCTSVVAANAATIIAELPESVNLSQTATMRRKQESNC